MSSKPIYMDSTYPIEARVEDLLSRMNLEEKVAQLNSVWASNIVENGKLSEEKLNAFLKNGIGQISRLAGATGLSPREVAKIYNEIQRFLVERTRLKIPAIVHEECLSGFMANTATTFPQAIGLASTWDPELIYKITSVIRKQMRYVGAHQGLSPVLDVARDPRWGRVEETLGEDPYLVATIGESYIKGLQGDDIRKGVVATAKHFAGHSFSEGGRNLAPVHVSPREFREVFLFPFEVAVKSAKVLSIMNAYHEIDGVPCASSKELLTKILRDEWGFSGVVVSDYGAIDMLRSFHKVTDSKEGAARLAIEAGIDIELPNLNCYGEPLISAVKKGAVSEATIDEAVKRVLRLKFQLGLFENPYVDLSEAPEFLDGKDEYRSLALEAARESIILLKNDGNLLPLSKSVESIAVIGPNAASTRNLLGDYSFTAHLSLTKDAVPIVSILEGIKRKVSSSTKVYYAKGCEVTGSSKDGFEEAIELAKKSSVAVVVVGERSGLSKEDTSGEGRDRSELSLPGVQEELIKAVYETGTPTVVILVNGRPLAIPWVVEHVPSILEVWLPGEEGGNAVADVLFGDYNPSGKLPISFPKSIGQIPVYYNRKTSSFGSYVSSDSKSLFPFGHGLSYTKFEYSNLEIAPKKVEPAGEVYIKFEVKNKGSIKGDEVVQLYLRDVVASLTRPVKELKGFKRITLEPEEKKKVTFILHTDQLAFYDEYLNLVVEPGAYEVMIGSSSEDIRLSGSFEVVGEKKIVPKLRRYFSRALIE
ncbi:MAG: glycoside hydrolase family 3 N-terminal domain-containing protein [Thermoproteota archaeon]